MKKITLALALIALVVIVAIMANRRSQTSPEKAEILAAPANAAVSALATSTDPAPFIASTTKTNGVSYTSQEAVAAMLKKFGAVANLYDFNPEITNYSRNVVGPAKLESIVASTPTHVAQISNGRLMKIQSQIGGSDERRDPSVMKNWYAGPDVWTDQDAIAETMRILNAIGAVQTLAKIGKGKKEVDPVHHWTHHDDGTTTKTTPFKTVRLYKENGNMVVEAEYRMGTKGSEGLTVWFHLGR